MTLNLRRLLWTSLLLLALGLTLFVPSPTQAALGTVDTFSTDQTTIERVVGTDPIPSSVSSTASGGGILGGERDIQINITAGTTTGNRLSSGVGVGLLSVGYEPSVEGAVQIVWDGCTFALVGLFKTIKNRANRRKIGANNIRR